MEQTCRFCKNDSSVTSFSIWWYAFRFFIRNIMKIKTIRVKSRTEKVKYTTAAQKIYLKFCE